MAIKKLFRKNKNQNDAHEEHRHGTEAHLHAAHDEGEGNWLVSYADMMTLLCGFFIMMFSMANIDQQKYEKVREEVSKTFKGQYENPIKELEKQLSQVIEETGIKKDTHIASDATSVSLTFESSLFFISGSADITENGKTIIQQLIAAVQKIQTQKKTEYKITVEGHTDTRPITSGIYPSNWELSSARASHVVRMFLDKQFSSKKLIAIGYADARPKVADRTPSGEWNDEAMAKNRRVVIRVLHSEINSIPWETADTSPTAVHQVQPPAPPATSAH